MTKKTLYALDFDGVICDSAVETAITGWKAAQDIWPDMQGHDITDQHIQNFRKIRPILEFGYEAILIIRLLQQGVSVSELAEHYHKELEALIKNDNLDKDNLRDCFGSARDTAIKADETAWIASNPVFKGVIEKLEMLHDKDWYIITTKQERFVERILTGNGIKLDETRIYGLDRNLNKHEVLNLIKTMYPDRLITFVEDRLPTLLGISKNDELEDIKLELADWGYNTGAERKQAKESAIEVIAIDDFLAEL